MVRLIVHMNIRPLYIRKTLQFYLKFLSYVMCSSQCSFWVHDDVYFDNEAGTGVVGTHSVYLEDGGGVCHRDVGDVLQHGRISCNADEKLKFRVRGSRPQEDDQDG